MMYRSSSSNGNGIRAMKKIRRHCGRAPIRISPIMAVFLTFIVVWMIANVLLSPSFGDDRRFSASSSSPMDLLASRKLPKSEASKSLLLPASIWATRELSKSPVNISSLLTANETQKALELCGKFLYSSLHRAVHVSDMSQEVFVGTGDIDDMWIRDSVVQMTIYLRYMTTNSQHTNNNHAWLRLLVEGAIRRNAFNILQDPYANAYRHQWTDPKALDFRDQVIGRGGFVATRNYELDSGAYFLNHLYDYYLTPDLYRPEALLQEPMILEAVLLMVDTWIVEQHHDLKSPYRYVELPNEGKGVPTAYTGMTWSGFRPSDDACLFGYLISANIHAAAALERILILNEQVWQHGPLHKRAAQLLQEIEQGIEHHGIVQNEDGERIYAYEVDGMGGIESGWDDANIPSLLSIPLLGWSGYDRQVYRATRKHLLSPSNKYYYKGGQFEGIGSPHTARQYAWPMSFVVQGLTAEGEGTDREAQMVFQMRQLLRSACRDAMHESVHVAGACRNTRAWFEWANALFVVYVEATMGVQCDAMASDLYRSANLQVAARKFQGHKPIFYSNPWRNNYTNPLYYQDVDASVKYE